MIPNTSILNERKARNLAFLMIAVNVSYEKEKLRVEVRQTLNSSYETTRRLFPAVHR